MFISSECMSAMPYSPFNKNLAQQAPSAHSEDVGTKGKTKFRVERGSGQKKPLPRVQQNNLLRTTSVIKGIILLSTQGPWGLFLLCSLVQVHSFCWDVPHGVTPAACQEGNFVTLLLKIGVIYIENRQASPRGGRNDALNSTDCTHKDILARRWCEPLSKLNIRLFSR